MRLDTMHDAYLRHLHLERAASYRTTEEYDGAASVLLAYLTQRGVDPTLAAFAPSVLKGYVR